MGSTRSSRSRNLGRLAAKAKPQALSRSARVSRRQELYYGEDESLDEYEDEIDEDDTIIVLSPPMPVPRIRQIKFGDSLFVEEDSPGGILFKSLPIEVHQNIIEFLPTDRDVAIYARLSNGTQSAVSSSVWRKRFERTFDMIDGLDAVAVAEKYKKRRGFFKRWTIFDIKKLGGVVNNKVRERQWLEQRECLVRLTDLILESNAYKTEDGNGNEIIVDQNMQFLRELTCEKRAQNVGNYLDILDSLLEDDYTLKPRDITAPAFPKDATVMIVQLCLLSIILHPTYSTTKVCHFDNSQDMVYGTETKEPLFSGRFKQSVNLPLLLHTANFFKFHFKAGIGEGLLCQAYKGLEPDQYPQSWIGHIKSGTQELGSHWKGTYTWMDDRELLRLRSWKSKGEIYSDAVDDEESFLDMTLFFDDTKFNADNWPQQWDAVLQSDPYAEFDRMVEPKRLSPRKKNKGVKRPEIKQFWGSSRGLKNGHMYGRVHALPNQQEFHGWQRVTIMKFFANNAGEYDQDQVWAYEGCVLPGGRMILGRWRDARADPATPDSTVSGPFIFWNVDRSTVCPPIETEEALDFAKSVHDPTLMGF